MKITFSFLLLLLAFSSAPAETPRLFTSSSFNAADLAEAVNHFVVLGEEASVRDLTCLAPDHDYKRDRSQGFSVPERVGWVCRILFTPKGQAPLRSPGYGAHELPWRSMPLSRWPLFPVASSASSFFVLAEGYHVFGSPEEPLEYLAYCRANGRFRTRPVAVPGRAQARRDASALRRSRAWRAINWQDTYGFPENDTWSFIQTQADTIR